MKHFLRFRGCYCPKRIQPIYLILITSLLLTVGGKGAFAQRSLSGTVVDTTGSAITGATVTIKGSSARTLTDDRGRFTLRAPEPTGTLVISYLGHQSITEKFDTADGVDFHFKLVPTDNLLEEVEVSTGYQTIPKERATGSFVFVDSALLNRAVGSNVLDRLRGVARGVAFNAGNAGVGGGEVLTGGSDISIRGLSTIRSGSRPLVVVDNFPFEGDISTLNPNDVHSVTLLEDAAASSVWGAYAGNGVIVITTKSGRYGQPTNISVNMNTGVRESPDLYYTPTISLEDYIEVERFLFGRGAYDARISQRHPYITPAVELLHRHREGLEDDDSLAEGLSLLKGQDMRRDLGRYVYGRATDQRFSVNIGGGTQRNKYYLSAGFDSANPHLRDDGSDRRTTFLARNTVRSADGKLELTAGLQLSIGGGEAGVSPRPGFPVMYGQLADNAGTPLSLGGGSLRQSYIDTAGNGQLTDWNLRPLDELDRGLNRVETRSSDYRLQAVGSYRLFPGLDLSLNYQYSNGERSERNLVDGMSNTARDLYNTYARIDGQTGSVSSAVPSGGYLDQQGYRYTAHNLRGQLGYRGTWRGGHELALLAGMEMKKHDNARVIEDRMYGYAAETETYSRVSYLDMHALYYQYNPNNRYYTLPGSAAVPRLMGHDRERSYFANGSYTFRGRYVASISARKDASNIFGVNANQRGVPLWSAGLKWRLADEPFYHFHAVPGLNVRLSYGHSGNANKSLAALVTTSAYSANYYRDPYQVLNNPPNGSLRWEKVKMLNAGLEFTLKGGRLGGVVEYYARRVDDLIGSAPFPPSTGVTVFTGNSAAMKGSGVDIQLNSRNTVGKVAWSTVFLFSRVSDEVVRYESKPANSTGYFSNIGAYPIVGKPVFPLFSYVWRGLDSDGNPQGELDGMLTADYARIMTATPLEQLVYNGRATPSHFGSLRNDISFSGITLSFNISYKLGYAFRRLSVDYAALYNINSPDLAVYNPDYARRWQQAGDELRTQVPRADYPANASRNTFYQRSSVLVERGDHIRLDDIRIAYAFTDAWIGRLGMKELQLYGYLNNIGLLWKATGFDIDPDRVPYKSLSYPNPVTYNIGFTMSL